ncbi:BTAD domain-containing putative transcriptional regulator [Flindersiella endophytica]
MLVALLLEAGHPVSVERLKDEVWGEQVPAGATNQIHGYVVRLRRLLGDVDGELLASRSPGYELHLSPDELDAGVFERLAHEGVELLRSGEPGAAARVLVEALALWRGQALADVEPSASVRTEVERLEQLRLFALETRIEADLRLGRHRELVTELPALIDNNPLREEFWAQLMLALYRCGRQSEALETYQKLYAVLDSELAVQPTRQLRDLHEQILNADPALDLEPPANAPEQPATDRPVPRQLRGFGGVFVGREPELRALDEAPTDSVLTVIYGPGGVGKTALALYWAGRNAHRFPDGQLYVDLRGYAEEPELSVTDALGQLLRSLGIASERVPREPEEASALLRSLLAERQVLVLLDNAADAGQVRPLLPGPGASRAVVTSRNRLPTLVALELARQIELGPLSSVESTRLLRRLTEDQTGQTAQTAQTAQADQASHAGEHPAPDDLTAELAELCGRLPLALRVAAAQVTVNRFRGLSGLVSELRQVNPIHGLRLADDPAGTPQAVLDLSYRKLTEPERRLFRLLGVFPGADLSLDAAAALAGLECDVAGELLEGLANRCLVEYRGPRRYGLHDLLHSQARALADRDEPEPERVQALDRLLDWYVVAAGRAVELASPSFVRWEREPPASVRAPFDDDAGALAWIDGEQANLVALTRHAADAGRPGAWQLAGALRGVYFLRRRFPDDWLATARSGLAAARAAGDLPGKAICELSLGQALRCVSDCEAAEEHIDRAVELTERSGWLSAQATALNERAVLWLELGDAGAAIQPFERALAVQDELGDTEGKAVLRINLGLARYQTGNLQAAVTELEQARELLGDSGYPYRRAGCLVNLGLIYRELGRLEAARESLETALRLEIRLGVGSMLVTAMGNLANVCRDLGDARQALDRSDAALLYARESGSERLLAIAMTIRSEALLAMGWTGLALRYLYDAVTLHESLANPLEHAEALLVLADVHLARREFEAASAAVGSANSLARTGGHLAVRAKATALQARIRYATDDHAEAEALARTSLDMARETGTWEAERAASAVLEALWSAK